jgi:ABC-type branched-subunit amino acid transport system substrate-binding protein
MVLLSTCLLTSAITVVQHGSTNSPATGWGRDIVVGGPVSLNPTSPLFSYGKQLTSAASMFATWINEVRGGIAIGGERHPVRFVFVDDANHVEQTLNATRYAITIHNADFIVGGYSTRLTMGVSKMCKAQNKIMLSAGSGVPTVFQASTTSVLCNGGKHAVESGRLSRRHRRCSRCNR